MANRSDRTSVLPRQYKRQIALARDLDTEERRRIVRKLFIKAHAHGEAMRKTMLAQKGPIDREPTESTSPATP